jgi:hypothetical protein
MTAAEAKRVEKALSTLVAKARAVEVGESGSIWRITLPFKDHRDKDFHVYVYHPPNSRKIVLTDGGAMVKGIKGLGRPHLKSIQDLLATFGLSLMEDMTTMEKSDRSLSIRMMSYLQAWCAVDGMFRIWKVTKEEETNVRSAGAEGAVNGPT